MSFSKAFKRYNNAKKYGFVFTFNNNSNYYRKVMYQNGTDYGVYYKKIRIFTLHTWQSTEVMMMARTMVRFWGALAQAIFQETLRGILTAGICNKGFIIMKQ